jgi:hypothetical protein
MRTTLLPVLIASIAVLLISITILYVGIFMFPSLMEEYYNATFRSSSFDTDILFYIHPFILCAGLKLFWDKFKGDANHSAFSRALTVALSYGGVAMAPVLWLTFSAIDISMMMVLTWLVYGVLQAFIATLVFAKMTP